MKRRARQELLDTDSGSAAEIAASLRDLCWFNRWFGGLPTVRQLLRDAHQQTGKSQLSVLEIASGEGFVCAEMRRDFRRSGVELRFTLLDRRTSHLPKNGAMLKISAEALRLPFADNSFDFVSCSLFVHHLPPAEVVVFVREALRVARYGLLIHDLIRDPVHLAFAYAGLPLYRSRITRNDAPASVWQAYTIEEMTNMLREAGARDIQVRTRFLYRMGVIAWKR